MKLGRIATVDGVAFAVIEPAEDTADGQTPQVICKEITEHPFGNPQFSGRSWPLEDVRLLAPILASKVVCVGKNYADHAAEMDSETTQEPLLFIKPNTTIIGPNAPIIIPEGVGRVDYEGELAVVIGQPCKDVAVKDAENVILGYTIANDVTARDLQSHDGQWTRAKGFDTFCPLGPWIETDLDPLGIDIRTTVERATGTLDPVQDGNTSSMVHTITELVSFVSGIMTLLPGDVILTGTPAGIGPIDPGDTVSVEIEGIGRLTNPVQSHRG